MRRPIWTAVLVFLGCSQGCCYCMEDVLVAVRLMFKIKFYTMCSRKCDIKVEVGQSVYLFFYFVYFCFSCFLQQSFHIWLELVFFNIPWFVFHCFTDLLSLLFQYFSGLGNFFFSVYFELTLVWPSLIKHNYVSCSFS